MEGTATALTLRGKSVVALRAKLPLLAAGAPTSWVEMAYESEWRGHPSGAFAFGPAAFESIVARFDADENPLPVTYGHPDHGGGNPTPAAGWIQQIEIRHGSEGAELWGLVEWTDKAADLIRAGEYRYCSLVVDFAPIDRATGAGAGEAEMYELGLTNSPFLPGMTPITLSRVGAPARTTARSLSMDPKKVLSAIAKALGLPDTAAPEKMKRAFDALVALMGAMSEEETAPETIEELSASKDADAKLARIVAKAAKLSKSGALKLADDLMEPASVEATETAATMAVNKLMTATGLDEAAVLAGIEANLDAIASLITGTPAAGMSSDAPALAAAANLARVTELTSRANAQAARIAELTADLAKRTAAETEQRIAAHFSRLVTEGKAGEGERATFLSLSAKSEEIALAAYDARTPVTPPVGQIGSGPKAAPPAKAPAAHASADPSDPVALSKAIAKGLSLKGAAADKFAADWLANHERNTDA